MPIGEYPSMSVASMRIMGPNAEDLLAAESNGALNYTHTDY